MKGGRYLKMDMPPTTRVEHADADLRVRAVFLRLGLCWRLRSAAA